MEATLSTPSKAVQSSTQSEDLQTMTVKQWCAANGIASISGGIRANKNGYPYITFVNGANEGNNVYFSKRASETVAEGQAIQRGFFDGYQMALTSNAEGTQIWKLASFGEGIRQSVDSLF